MGRIAQDIFLDFCIQRMPQFVNTKQSESNRSIKIKLLNNGSMYNIPSGSTAMFRARKSNGTTLTKPCAIDKNGVLTAELTQQMLDTCGDMTADICLAETDGTIASTETFIIRVDELPNGADVLDGI